ncbi:Acg family FMN-binding oxidoreductase [Catellatospora bangladeshensis]|uniref:NAD(P)H nitroreductase n=1 Tax=Catellatospora bangladeshensis TaxID=310355 RepID=A0A8J3JVR7_9ACTN|nr:nitroreductase family protein [Catellatospora bangladeshensis]GIF84604.1 NAD(P)H nitroreductase [Catellatospora bangladeshensis]
MNVTRLGLHGALLEAARDALAAPSVFNSQPWIWRTGNDSLQLFADQHRRLATDPDSRQLLISCGCALHHACVALSANGLNPEIRRHRVQTPGTPLAVITIRDAAAHDTMVNLYRAMARRHTDRRAFTAEPVSSASISTLVAAAEQQGVHLQPLTDDQMIVLREAATEAASRQATDPIYQEELLRWTNRPADAGDGIPAVTAVNASERRVPVRDFTYFSSGFSAGPEHDVGATYALLFADADTGTDRLRAGEALSAVLLTATAAGLGSAPISDVIEFPDLRARISRLIYGPGHPQILVRVGHPPPGKPAHSPRRPAAQMLDPP